MNDICIIPVGSGSTGNCFYLEMDSHHILIDMGMGYRKVKAALEKHGRNIEDIEAVFVTHGHGDHIRSAEALCHHVCAPIYADGSSFYPIRKTDNQKRALEAGREYEILEGLFVTMFTVPHDYVKTCGYSFRTGKRKLSYVTDCGAMSESILEYIYGSDTVIIEANHDVEMLKKGPYPYYLKQRILSKHGHLSNEDCAITVDKLYEKGTRSFLLAHLSRHNNTPDLARKIVEDALQDREHYLYVCPPDGDDLIIL